MDRSPDGTLIDFFGRKLFVPANHYAADSLISTGASPEFYIQRLFVRLIPKDSTVIDIGANIGFHTLCIASIVGDGGKVYAVEADIDNASSIRISIRESHTQNIFLLPVAAAEKTGILRMLSSTQTNSAFSRIANTKEGKTAVTVRLDDVISDKIDFIKIDVEGAELLAMKGMERIITESRPTVLSEFSPNYMIECLGVDLSVEYLNYFLQRGYYTYLVDYNGDTHLKETATEIMATRDHAYHVEKLGHIELLFSPSKI